MTRIAACLACVGLLTASRAPAQRADTAAVAAITRLEDAWARALITRDGATFQRLLAPDFIYTEDDRVMSRSDVIRDVVSGTDTVKAARNQAMAVHLFGGTGVVTGWLIVSGRGTAGSFEHRYRFTDTWVRRGDMWQIVAAQDYVAK
jgi:ketosteroid isomerase-like protein